MEQAKSIGGATLAAALALVGLVLITSALRGNYYAIWRVMTASPSDFAIYQAGISAAQQPGQDIVSAVRQHQGNSQ